MGSLKERAEQLESKLREALAKAQHLEGEASSLNVYLQQKVINKSMKLCRTRRSKQNALLL